MKERDFNHSTWEECMRLWSFEPEVDPYWNNLIFYLKDHYDNEEDLLREVYRLMDKYIRTEIHKTSMATGQNYAKETKIMNELSNAENPILRALAMFVGSVRERTGHGNNIMLTKQAFKGEMTKHMSFLVRNSFGAGTEMNKEFRKWMNPNIPLKTRFKTWNWNLEIQRTYDQGDLYDRLIQIERRDREPGVRLNGEKITDEKELFTDQLAYIISEMRKKTMKMKNDNGILVTANDSFGFHQTHNISRMLNAGFKEWVKVIYPLLDEEKTFFNLKTKIYAKKRVSAEDKLKQFNEQKVEVLKKVWGTLTKQEPQIFEKLTLSQPGHRNLYFKGGKQFEEYMNAFGVREGEKFDLFSKEINSYEVTAENIAIVKFLGTSPEHMFEKILKHIPTEFRKRAKAAQEKGDEKAFNDLQKKAVDFESNNLWDRQRLETAFDLTMGKDKGIGLRWLAESSGLFRIFQSMRLLGFAPISQTNDGANITRTLYYNGNRNWNILFRPFVHYYTHLTDKQGNIERAESLATSMIGHHNLLVSETGDDFSVGKVGRWMADSFFRLTGSQWLDNANRAGLATSLAYQWGKNVKLSYKDLDKYFTSRLNYYGISEQDWDFVNHLWQTGELKIDNPFTRAGDKGLEIKQEDIFYYDRLNYIKNKSVQDWYETPNNYLADLKRKDLKDKFNVMMQGEINRSIINVTDYERSFIPGGIPQAGTFGGELVRSLLQLKLISYALLTRGVGAEFAASPTVMERIQRVAAFTILTTIYGVAIHQAKNFVKGIQPRDLFDEETGLNGELLAAGFLQSGALAYIGDFLFADRDRHGSYLEELLTGPSLDEIYDITKTFSDLTFLSNRDKWPNLSSNDVVKEIRAQIPYANLWYSKFIFDRLLFWNLLELTEPGYKQDLVDRYAQYGLEYQSHPVWTNLPKVSALTRLKMRNKELQELLEGN